MNRCKLQALAVVVAAQAIRRKVRVAYCFQQVENWNLSHHRLFFQNSENARWAQFLNRGVRKQDGQDIVIPPKRGVRSYLQSIRIYGWENHKPIIPGIRKSSWNFWSERLCAMGFPRRAFRFSWTKDNIYVSRMRIVLLCIYANLWYLGLSQSRQLLLRSIFSWSIMPVRRISRESQHNGRAHLPEMLREFEVWKSSNLTFTIPRLRSVVVKYTGRAKTHPSFLLCSLLKRKFVLPKNLCVSV